MLLHHLRQKGLVLASGNAHKLGEFRRILEPRGIELLSATEVAAPIDVPETADTFRGNAALKALAYCRHVGRPVIADDSGLVVDALDGAPGVYSARYGGPDLDDAGRRRHLLAELERVQAKEAAARRARFVCVLALCLAPELPETDALRFPDSDGLRFYEGKAEGWIAFEERGDGGFGYDPVFCDGHSERTYAELSAAEKDARSHRGQALAAFLADLAE